MAAPVRALKIEKSGIQIAQWDNDGKISYTIDKSYRDKSGVFKKTNRFFLGELAKLRYVLNTEFPELDTIDVKPQPEDDLPF